MLTSTITPKRKLSLDYIKGISILLLIFMHCGASTDGKFKIVISAFFMSIFYIVCGILIAMKNPHGLSASEFLSYFRSRFYQILIPYFIFGSILIAFFQMLHIIGGEPLTLKQQLLSLLLFNGIESMWFLTRYLLAEMLFLFVLLRLPKYLRVFFFLLSIIGVSIISLHSIPDIWPLSILAGTWLALIFVYIGFLIQKLQLTRKTNIILTLCIFLFSIFLSLQNGPISIASIQLQNPLIFFISSTGLCFVLIYLCEHMEKSNIRLSILQVFGKNTIVIVCTNNLLIEIVRLLDYKLTGNLLIQMGLWGNILFALILAFLEYIIIKLSSGRLSFLFGKNYHKP